MKFRLLSQEKDPTRYKSSSQVAFATEHYFLGFGHVLVFRSQSANRIDELYYKGMRLEETQQREKAPKVVLAGHKEEGKKKDTPAPLWAGA